MDGPGLRTVLFVQGCEQKCLGCHNPNTWDIGKGRIIEIEDLINELRANISNKKLTISGGEPLLQYPAVLELVKGLPDFNLVLYTGFEFEEVPTELLGHLDYIKVGKYEESNRCTTVDYLGSTNQRFIPLRRVNKL